MFTPPQTRRLADEVEGSCHCLDDDGGHAAVHWHAEHAAHVLLGLLSKLSALAAATADVFVGPSAALAACCFPLGMASANHEDDSIGGFWHQNNAGLSPQDPKKTVEQAHGLGGDDGGDLFLAVWRRSSTTSRRS